MFSDLNTITSELRKRNIDVLIEWCEKHLDCLKKIHSILHFDSLKLKFISMFRTHSSNECVDYSKKIFKSYINDPKYFDQISKLMTLLIFKDNISNSPYNEYNEEMLWKQILTNFVNDCCSLLCNYNYIYFLALPSESGFFLTMLAGMVSLPQILKAEEILKTKKELLTNNELPYEIHLPNELKFHSVFICPVTKEISTPSNPPMLLTCGHTVSSHALEKMIKGTSSVNSSQIKCPTCPNIQNAKDALKLQIF